MRLSRLVPRTIRGQITFVIVAALLTVIIAGRALERWAKSDGGAPNMETITERVNAVAELLKFSTPQERDAILANAGRAGWKLSLQPASVSTRFTGSPEVGGIAASIVEWLFPTDGATPPIGGWRTFLDGERVIALEIDNTTLLVLSGIPDAILTSATVSQGAYYIVAVIVLVLFFFLFAIKAITEPIRRISQAANEADIANGSQIFKERGSVEIVALARALNGMRNRIRIMVESRTRMLRGIGHDLRTPLTRLRLRTERLDEGPLREALLSDVVRIDRLLAESLNYLRDDYAIEPMQKADLVSILQTVCAEFSDIGFQVRYAGPDRMIVHCKPLAMMRAITNLCDNGVKFADHVTVRLSETKAGYEITVSDDGPGIPSDLRARVLEPFFKVDQARMEGKAGFGLGLSIVADIVQAHHGLMELSDTKPRGLTVTIAAPKTLALAA